MYITHLPLVIALQAMIRDWQQPAFVKFAVLCVATTAILLMTYQLFVRYTWLGTMLNGPRKRERLAAQPSVGEGAAPT